MPRSWDRSAPPLLAIETWQRLRNRAFTAAASSSLGARGRGSVFQTPVKLAGASRIFLGADVQVGRGSWLQVLEPDGRLELRDGVRITGFLFASAAREIVIEEHALLAQNVYVADHSHARDDPGRPISMQGIADVAPVRIGAGCWLGQGVIVMPGVTIGAGAIVGSNSVVRDDVPPRSVAVGAPARVVRALD